MGEATDPDVAFTPSVSGVRPPGSPGEAGPDSTDTPVVVVVDVGSFGELW